jgi:hypothetical protein
MRFFGSPTFSLVQRPFMLAAALLLGPALMLGAALTCGADNGPVMPEQTAFKQQIQPLTQKFCGECHGANNPAAGIHLTDCADVAALQRDSVRWRKSLTQLRDRTMPPKDAQQPTEAPRKEMIDSITLALNATPDGLTPRNPGRVLIHRLNRAEYNNTVRDLFGVTSWPADGFPADDGGGGGFDNDADTLFLPPLLMERYLQAAGQVLEEAKPERLFFIRPDKMLSRTVANPTCYPQIVYCFSLAAVKIANATKVARLLLSKLAAVIA